VDLAERTEPTTLSMSQGGRKYLWDIENQAFQISYKAAPQFNQALARGDREAVEQFFADDFQGSVFAAGTAEIVRREFAEFSLQSSARHGTEAVDRVGFARWLLEQVQRFSQPPKVQLPLVHLRPVDRRKMDGPWEGQWILRIFGQMGDGPGEVVAKGQFRAEKLPQDFASERGWISKWEIAGLSVARATHVLMEDATSHCGIDTGRLHDNWKVNRRQFKGTPGAVYACDYNGDGNIDLLVADDGPPLLYAGHGDGRFADVTLQTGLPWERPKAGIAMFADLDNDGDEDLFLGTAILENRDGRFARRGYLPLSDTAVGLAVADYDRDGLVDVYASNSAPAPQVTAGRTSWIDDASGIPNKLYRNRGAFVFEDQTDQAGAAAGNRSTFTSVWLDADDDGWPDLYVINELGSNVLLRNERNGTFSERHIGPAFDGFAMGVTAGDLDEDGRIDLYVGNMFSKAGQRIINNIPPNEYPDELIERMRGFVAGNMLLLNRSAWYHEWGMDSATAAVGWAYGPAALDLDGDGLLDIHSTAGFASFDRDEFDG
jgi:hypothetical protein